MMNELIFATTSAILAGVAALGIYRFISQDRDVQMAKVAEWLLWAVTIAEKECGGGTGKIKLRKVYSMFAETWPKVATWMSFETFSGLVDEALIQMKALLRSNVAAYRYVKGIKEVEE